jgi:hypothetical protein
MTDDKPVKITDVLDRAGVPHDKREKFMNMAKRLLSDIIIWNNTVDRSMCRFGSCDFNNASVVYIRRGDEQKVLDTFSNENFLLGATNG